MGEEGQQIDILRKVSNGWLLMRNVSFTFNKYEDYSGILSADIAQGTLFDGNMHSLVGGAHGIPCAIFGSNSGTIENLWVKKIKILFNNTPDCFSPYSLRQPRFTGFHSIRKYHL